jgi:hypothetical protein
LGEELDWEIVQENAPMHNSPNSKMPSHTEMDGDSGSVMTIWVIPSRKGRSNDLDGNSRRMKREKEGSASDEPETQIEVILLRPIRCCQSRSDPGMLAKSTGRDHQGNGNLKPQEVNFQRLMTT